MRSSPLNTSDTPDTPLRLRVATYNIHKCQGFDRKIRPERIIAVLQELHADILCLQEVVNAPDGPPRFDQAGQIERALPGYSCCFGANRPLHGGVYGNMVLSRFPILRSQNHNLTHRREERGVLQADIEMAPGRLLHLFNVHLGTGFAERRHQGHRLLGEEILTAPGLHAPRLVLGDFNEWTYGLTSKLLRSTFRTFDPHHGLHFPRTFPGMFPLLTLDHCYYEPPMELTETLLWRSRTALIASDHLPLIADFRLASVRASQAA